MLFIKFGFILKTFFLIYFFHDMRLLQELFPRTIVMDNGNIMADGLTMEILENEKLLTAHGLEKP